uniref:Cysteine sulfinic acid decarboxylase n=1 Tax=Hucho hucho TaxID=62062 RepID=A0A4W5JVZ9_9TELE
MDHREGQHFLTQALKVIMKEGFLVLVIPGLQVCEWREPEELAALLDLELRENGESQHQLLQRVRDVAKYSVKTNHPSFFNQLFALNTSQYTYDVAPVFVLMEYEVLAKLRSLVGWTEGDGIFCPGGSVSNMYAMNVARCHTFPEVKLKGLWALPPLAVFTSQESHYSVMKAAAFQGIGTENVFQIKVDDWGCMIPEDLDEKIELAKSQEAFPFLVHATSGTLQGAFDPLEPIADIYDRQGLWMPEFVNMCFWFIPPSLRGKENSPDYQSRLSEVGPVIRERMMKQGTMMVGYQPHGGRVNFFRMIVVSPKLSQQDMIFFLDEIERLGNDL